MQDQDGMQNQMMMTEAKGSMMMHQMQRYHNAMYTFDILIIIGIVILIVLQYKILKEQRRK